MFNTGLVFADRPSIGPASAAEDASRFKHTLAFGAHATRIRLSSGLWAYSFDGVDDYVQISAPLPLYANYTFSQWCFFIGNPQHGYGGNMLNFWVNGILTVGDTWKITHNYCLSDMATWRGVSSGDGAVSKGIWTHLSSTLTISGADSIITLYRDGVLLNSGSQGGRPYPYPGYAPLLQSTTRGYNGYLALPKVWDRALSAAEILAIYESERRWFGV